jgi:hypothetical protein
VILVNRDEATKIRTVVLDKAKDEEEGAKFEFELPQIVLGVDPSTGRQITSCVCIPVAQKEAVRRSEELKGQRLTPAAELFMKAYFQAERRYGYPVPQMMPTPAKVRSVTPWEDVKRMYQEMSPSDVLTPDAQTTEEALKAEKAHRAALKVRLQRHREDLTAMGVVGTQNDGRITVMFWTGKGLRAFPHTIERQEEDDNPAMDIPF